MKYVNLQISKLRETRSLLDRTFLFKNSQNKTEHTQMAEGG